MTFRYDNSTKLRMRREIYDRFSNRTQSWNSWLQDRILENAQASIILDLGGGYGSVWSDFENERLLVVLTDLSYGMLSDASHLNIPRAVMSAEQVAVKTGSIDLVTAFNVLYHVNDRRAAFSEITRALKDAGSLLFTTIGKNHLRELSDLVKRHAANADAMLTANNYPFEDAVDEAAQYFDSVSLKVFPDSLIFDEPDAIVEYIRTTPAGEGMSESEFSSVEREARELCKSGSGFKVGTEVGLVTCKQRRKRLRALERRESSGDCPFCHENPEENEFWIKIVSMVCSKLCLARDQTYRGQCLLIYQGGKHAVSLDELDHDEYLSLVADLRRAVAAIRKVFAPDHMNVELLGNIEPHLHFHIIPRYHDDPRWTRPIWLTEPGTARKTFLSRPAYEKDIESLRRALATV